ncbi:MAG TPA: hypothetical protein VLG92_01525 [Candidatus Saccharimonadia bacterium]|nr:hypothetical protein [Candidatus Saccharimonadia bacterium]
MSEVTSDSGVLIDLSTVFFPDSDLRLASGVMEGVGGSLPVSSGPKDPTYCVDEQTIGEMQGYLLVHGISPETRSAVIARHMTKSREVHLRSATGRLSIRALLFMAEQDLRRRLAEEDVALEALLATRLRLGLNNEN